MTVKMPGAVWKPIKGNYTRRVRARTDCVILHIAVTEASSLHGWFSNPKAYASSHFYVRRDGTIEQYLGAEYISWANGAGNYRAITVETQGMGTGKWTSQQVEALARICAFAKSKFGVTMALMPNSKPSSKGVGYHRLGCDPWRVAGGESWSKAYGKICPGGERIPQIPGIVALAGGGIDVVPVVDKKPIKKPKPTAGTKNKHLSKAQVKNVQKALQSMGYYKGAIDGVAGPVTEEAIEYYQMRQLFGKLVVDGVWGPKTEAHYKWVKTLQTAMNKWKGTTLAVDGDFGKRTKARVEELMERNHGRAYKGAIDAIPGPVFCKMLGVPTHP